MQDKCQSNFNWNTYINDKAIVEFERDNKLFETKMNMNRYYLLSFFIDLYTNPKKVNKIRSKYIEGVKFIYASSSFILNNLMLLKVKERTLLRMIDELECKGYIQRHIVNSTYRYIKINNDLLEYTRIENRESLRPIGLKELAVKTGKYFGKTEEHQLTDVYEFLENLSDLDYFENKLNEYVEFKEYSLEAMPRFRAFCKDWDQHNWKLMLEQRKLKDSLKEFN